MGSDNFYPEERPVHSAHVDGFWIDRPPGHEYAEFAGFIESTGYITTIAERRPNPSEYPDVQSGVARARLPGVPAPAGPCRPA